MVVGRAVPGAVQQLQPGMLFEVRGDLAGVVNLSLSQITTITGARGNARSTWSSRAMRPAARRRPSRYTHAPVVTPMAQSTSVRSVRRWVQLPPAAEDRGVAMSLATAAEYVLMLTDPGPPQPPVPSPGKLSARERELVRLVAQGRSNAEIAAELHISVRTVGSHLDRIRDKTGCRRRADLTRLALTMGLV